LTAGTHQIEEYFDDLLSAIEESLKQGINSVRRLFKQQSSLKSKEALKEGIFDELLADGTVQLTPLLQPLDKSVYQDLTFPAPSELSGKTPITEIWSQAQNCGLQFVLKN
jgi:hypothetical protein